ncbi:unnamed protein product, partial [Callosobruchus maculatus]
HSRRLEKVPTNASRKLDIQNWLRSKNISFDESLLEVELLQIVNEHRSEYNKYTGIDEMAKEQNKIVLRRPPYHCELNPIELVWAEIKNTVAEKNTTFKFADVKNHFQEAIGSITADKWQKCIRHIQEKVEQEMWRLATIIENIEPVIVNL